MQKYKSGYNKIRVIISGSRSFDDYDTLCKVCDYMLLNSSSIEIVSGGLEGADRLGERYAKEKGYWCQNFKSDYEKFGKGACMRKNESMAKYSDVLIMFWDGLSMETMHMINLARFYKLKVKVFRYDNRRTNKGKN